MKNLENLKHLDMFGVKFELRMKNYTKFQSKTGALSFLLYIFFSFICVGFIIFESINNPKYSSIDYDELALNDTINLVDQDFSFAFRTTLVKYKNKTLENFFYIELNYKYSNSFQEGKDQQVRNYSLVENIPQKNCNMSGNFSNDDLNYLPANFENYNTCFNFTEKHTINGYFYTKNFSLFQIKFKINKKYNNKTILSNLLEENPNFLNIDIFYPKLMVQKQKDFSIKQRFFDSMNLKFNLDVVTSTNFFLKKNIYIQDSSVFKYSHERKYEYTQFEHEETSYNYETITNYNVHNSTVEPLDLDIGRMYVRQYFIQKINLKTIEKFLYIIIRINTFIVNFFLIFGLINKILNLKKAKKNVLENLFQIITNDEENISATDYQMENNKKLNNNQSREKIDSHSNKKQNKNTKNEKNRNTFDLMETEDNNSSKDIVVELPLDNKEIIIEKILKSREEIYVNGHKRRNGLNSEYNQDDVKNSKVINSINYNFTDKKITDFKNPQIKEKNFIISKIKKKIEKNKDLDNILGIRKLINLICSCKFREIKKLNQNFKNGEDKFDEFMDINNFIKKFQEIETIKYLILNEPEVNLFEFISTPFVKIDAKKISNTEDNKNILLPKFDEEILMNNYFLINEKNVKNSKELRILDLFEKRIF